eukprot:CAMPEP_0178694624 /NCGR_PEP_ID=MMETSP0699-20121125/8357_1 /TAXON_ID=265572 /ORGANISM="Extubocellulus spinifer, Strain CCMP396" /LENGTH=285 /DNA_ID=CAMNT_0020340139 /DNA_START=12 /DNA_END=869 /DNA_ORIENTATION=-
MAGATNTSPYPDPNRPPPPPDASVTRTFARLNPLGRALASALTTLEDEDEFDTIATSLGDDTAAAEARGADDTNKSSGSSHESGSKRGKKRPRNSVGEVAGTGCADAGEESLPLSRPKVDKKMKEHLLETFGDAVAATDWYGVDTNAYASDNSTALRENEEQTNDAITTSTSTCTPVISPAALLRGKVRHYNRIGGQWRILAKDVEIRPRVNLEGKEGQVRKRAWKKADRKSLWDRSLEEDGRQGDATAAAAATAEDSDLGGLDVDVEGSSIKFKGDVLILAYND